MNPSKNTTKALAAGLVGLLAIGGTLGFGTQIASAQDDTTPPAAEQSEENGRRGNRGHRGHTSEVLTELLGVDADALKEARSNDMTLADVAAANGVSVDELIAALVAEKQAHIAEKLEAGIIDADKAAEITANVEARVTDMVNGIRAERGERPEGAADGERPERGERGERGPRGERGNRGAAPTSDA